MPVGSISAEQYQCINEYQPSDYKGKVRVPTNCKLEKLDCPRSWKSGIPEGGETESPMIYQKFLTCHEGFTLCGYVPIDPKSGVVLGQSGVTVGGGVDLGSKSRASFPYLSSALVDKVEPYFALKQNFAACAAIERPLLLISAMLLHMLLQTMWLVKFQAYTTPIKLKTPWHFRRFLAVFARLLSAFGISLVILALIQTSGIS